MKFLSTAFFVAAIMFLVAWGIAVIATGLFMADMVFRLGHGSTPEMLLAGLITTFACYVGYFGGRKISYNLKYRRDW